MLARLRAAQLFTLHGGSVKLCGTIHDSIVVDCPDEMCYTVRDILKQSVEEVPDYCRKIWGYDFSLPLKCEISVGSNKTDMKEIN